MNSQLVLFSNTTFYKYVLNYIYITNKDKIKSFEYLSENLIKPYEYIRRNNITVVKVCNPLDSNFDINYNDTTINFKLETIVDNDNNYQKIIIPGPGCGSNIEEIIIKKITLKSDNNDTLIEYIDEAKKYAEEQINLSKKSTNKTIKINIWRKDYWNILFKSPKRPLETLYLKNGQKEEILNVIEDFYNPDTRAEYLSYGIPYKSVENVCKPFPTDVKLTVLIPKFASSKDENNLILVPSTTFAK